METLAGRNFGKLGDLLQTHQSFTHQLLVASEIAIEAGLKFAKIYFTSCNFAYNSPKFFPIKVSLYTAA